MDKPIFLQSAIIITVMKNFKKYIILFLIIVAIISIDLYFLSIRKTANILNNGEKMSTLEDPNSITYYCKEGIIKALYGKDTVELTFSDGHKESMNISMSASGARYESGTRVFWTKGDNAFMQDGDNQIYSKCVAGSTSTDEQGKSTYTDNAKSFSFSYPSQFSIYGGDVGYIPDWSYLSSQTSGVILSEVYVSKTFLPNTNFSEAKFIVGASSDPDAVKKCLKPDGVSGENGKGTEDVIIDSKNFTKSSMNDAGAGNYYEVTSYRTVYNDSCYSIEYMIHSTNISNYSPDQGVTQFNPAPIRSILGSMAESFKFLK